MITFADPVLQRARDFLDRTIESVLAQTGLRAGTRSSATTVPTASKRAMSVERAGGGRVGYVANRSEPRHGAHFNRCLELGDTELVTVLHARRRAMPPLHVADGRGGRAPSREPAAFYCGIDVDRPRRATGVLAAARGEGLLNPAVSPRARAPRRARRARAVARQLHSRREPLLPEERARCAAVRHPLSVRARLGAHPRPPPRRQRARRPPGARTAQSPARRRGHREADALAPAVSARRSRSTQRWRRSRGCAAGSGA